MPKQHFKINEHGHEQPTSCWGCFVTLIWFILAISIIAAAVSQHAS